MNIPEEILRTGRLIVYPDSDPEIRSEVEAYNRKMFELRQKKKKADGVDDAGNYVTVFFFLTRLLRFALAHVFLRVNPIVDLTVLISFIGLFVYFGLFKHNPIIGFASSALLFFWDSRFWFVFALDMLMIVFHLIFSMPLKKEKGYPTFADIYIAFEHHKPDEASQTSEATGEWIVPEKKTDEWIVPEKRDE